MRSDLRSISAPSAECLNSVRGAGTAFDVIDRTIPQHRITVKGSALTARRFCFKLLLVLDSYITPGLSGLTGSQASRPMSMADPHGFDLVGRGPSYRVAQRFGFNRPDRPRRIRKILLLILVTWVPLVLLSLVVGHAFGNRVAVDLAARSGDPQPLPVRGSSAGTRRHRRRAESRRAVAAVPRVGSRARGRDGQARGGKDRSASASRVGRRRGGDRGSGRGDRDHRAGGDPVRLGRVNLGAVGRRASRSPAGGTSW